MKKKRLMAFLLALSVAVTPATIMAEEKAEEVAEETAGTEDAAEEATEEMSAEEETEEASEVDLTYRPGYVASEYITLGEYKNLTVEATKEEITEESIEARLKSNVGNFGTKVMEAVTEGSVQEGDIVTIDYVGKKDGAEFDGGSAEGYELEIGSGKFIEGFEDGLVGVKSGETVDLELTFPEGYQAEELAGQDVVFTVTVHEIKRMPEEITDDMINTGTSGKYTTVEDYREYIRSFMEEDAQEAYENAIINAVMTLVSEGAEISGYPQDLVDYCAASMKAYYEQYAAYYSMDMESFVTAMGITMEEFEEEVLAAVERTLQAEFCYAAIAEAEGMEISEEEFQEALDSYMTMYTSYGYEYENEEAFLAEIGGENIIRTNLLQKKVQDFMLENTIVNEAAKESEAEES